MRFLIGILLLAAGVTLSPSPVLAQTGTPTHLPMLASLRSGNPQRVTHALERIQENALAQALYADLYRIAGSEPPSSTNASAAAKALGFVLIAGLDDQLEPFGAADRAEKLARLEQRLCDIDPAVSGVAEEFQWRAVELMQYAAAYDFLRAARGSPLPAAEQALAQFTDNTVRQLEQNFVVRNNLSIKLAAAAGYAALILRGGEYSGLHSSPEEWLATAMTHIDETLFAYQGNADGHFGYSEGPWYFRYAMQNLIPFFLAVDAASGGGDLPIGSSSVRSPLRDGKYQRLLEWIATLRMPDGMLPPFEDTYMQAWFPEAAAIAASVPGMEFCAWPNHDSGLRSMDAARLSCELSRNFDMRVEYLLSEASPQAPAPALPAMRVMPDAGYAVFRSGWEADALYFALIGKNGIARTHRSPVGSGHKHANETAFLLHAGGELLAIEPGYHSSAEREELIFGENHNILLVDGRGPDSTSWGSFLFGVDAYMADTLTAGTSGLVAVRTSYQGADIERRAAMLGGRFVVLTDHAASGRAREFTHQLHGNGLLGDGSCTLDLPRQRAAWTRNGMTLHALVASPGGAPAQETVTRRHAPAGQSFADHSALYSTLRGNETRFHTVLAASPAGATLETDILRQDGGVSAVSVTDGDQQLLSISNASGALVSATLPVLGSVRTDGLAMHCILNSAGRPDKWMLDGGSILEADGRLMLSSSLLVRAVAALDGSEIRLALRSAGELPAEGYHVALRVSHTVAAVEGPGVVQWALSGSHLLLHLDAAATDLRITLTSTVTGVSEAAVVAAPPAIVAVYPQPVSREGTLQCHFALPAAAMAAVTLHDALGRTVAEAPERPHEAGTHTAALRTSGLPAGMYFRRVRAAGMQSARRVIIR